MRTFKIYLQNYKRNEIGPLIYQDTHPRSEKGASREQEKVVKTLINILSYTPDYDALYAEFTENK